MSENCEKTPQSELHAASPQSDAHAHKLAQTATATSDAVNNLKTFVVKCERSGDFSVVVQGNRGSNEVCVLTAHDLGCNWKEFSSFIHHPSMAAIAPRIVWVHLVIPGQEEDAPDLPASFKFPSLQDIADDIPTILNELKISSVVLLGDGAGANILLRFGMSKDERILGMVLINATATAAGFVETHREKAVIGRRLSRSGINTAIEHRLASHRFGTSAKSGTDELNNAVETYCDYLRTKINQKNLALFTNAYYDRSNVSNTFNHIRSQLLLIAGAKSDHAHVTHTLHATILRALKDESDKRRLVEFLRVDGVVSVMHEKPEKLAECLQYFLQGLGLLGSVRSVFMPQSTAVESQRLSVDDSAIKKENTMINSGRRRLSMQDFDAPRGAGSLLTHGVNRRMPIRSLSATTEDE